MVADSPIDADLWVNQPCTALRELVAANELGFSRFFAACAEAGDPHARRGPELTNHVRSASAPVPWPDVLSGPGHQDPGVCPAAGADDGQVFDPPAARRARATVGDLCAVR